MVGALDVAPWSGTFGQVRVRTYSRLERRIDAQYPSRVVRQDPPRRLPTKL